MWSGRVLALLSLASVVAALIVTAVVGWLYGLGLYAASMIAFVLMLRRMARLQRLRSNGAEMRDASDFDRDPHRGLRT